MAFLPQLVGGLLQERPEVPEFKKVSLIDAQRQSTEANIANLAAGKLMATEANQFNQDEILKHLRQVIPGYDELISKTRGIIDSQLKGEIPKDVSDLVQRNAAVKAIGGGYGGSGMQSNLLARDLGLTSLQLTQQGMASADRWIQSARQNLIPELFDVTKMFISPTQQYAANVRDEEGQFNRDWLSNQLDADYSLGTIAGRALIKTDDQIMQIVSSLAGSVGGAYAGKIAGCWIAREVFGNNNPKWILFRHWLLTKAPSWLFQVYMRFGEGIANKIRHKPIVKALIRNWMEARIYGH